MIAIGPCILGFLLGAIIGSQIKTDNISDTSFSTSSYVIIFIAALIMAWQCGEFPFYEYYFPLSSVFLSAVLGVLLSKLIFARSS